MSLTFSVKFPIFQAFSKAVARRLISLFLDEMSEVFLMVGELIMCWLSWLPRETREANLCSILEITYNDGLHSGKPFYITWKT